MKPKVFYSAAHDEIWVKAGRDKILRGAQAKILKIPDYRCLFRFEVDLKKWKDHLEMGWLVELGEL